MAVDVEIAFVGILRRPWKTYARARVYRIQPGIPPITYDRTLVTTLTRKHPPDVTPDDLIRIWTDQAQATAQERGIDLGTVYCSL